MTRVGTGITPPGKTLIIAEVAQAHDGSLGHAHAFIDAIADAGADAAKFQTHIADAESTPDEPWRIKFSPQDDTRFEYWKRMEFKKEHWAGLKKHCDDRGILFLSSAFSFEAVELLKNLDMAAWKVASGEVTNTPLLRAMLDTKKPMLCSTGMSPWAELGSVAELAKSAGVPFSLFQCTSAYPCPPERLGLNVMNEIRERFAGVGAGLSDHSGTIYPCLAAAAHGADAVELHVTLSRKAFGPDVTSSITFDELETLTKGIRFMETALAHPIDKDAAAGDMQEMRRLFTKSVVAKTALEAGTVISMSDLDFRKPGTGISASRTDELIGRTLKQSYQPGEPLALDELKG